MFPVEALGVALMSMASGKAPGADALVVEAVKNAPTLLKVGLTKASKSWIQESADLLKNIPKQKQIADFREIVLMAFLMKTYLKMITIVILPTLPFRLLIVGE